MDSNLQSIRGTREDQAKSTEQQRVIDYAEKMGVTLSQAMKALYNDDVTRLELTSSPGLGVVEGKVDPKILQEAERADRRTRSSARNRIRSCSK